MKILSKSILVSIGMLLCIAVPAFAMDVTIEWHKNTESDVVGYYLYYKAGSSGPPYDGTGATEGESPVYVGDLTRYSLHGLSDGPMYYFCVTAYNVQGFESDYSDVVHKSSGSDTAAPQISNVQVSSITESSAVIEWTTGEGSSSVVQYGTSSSAWGNYSSSKSDTALVTSHSVTITGLSAVTTYYFRVGSTDSSGNGPDLNPNGTNPSGEGSFTTEAIPDITAPQISNVQVSSMTESSAVIEWTTDEGSSSVVQYGTSSSTWGNYSSSKSDTALVTSHSVTITGLSAQTSYYLRVGSTDGSGNGPDQNPNGTNPSGEGSFTTGAIPDITAPQISNVQVNSITEGSAVIEWTTDEGSSSVVQYGTSSSTWGNYSSSKSDTALVTSHSVTLTPLAGDTMYYFRVGSTDGSDNGPSISNEMSFTTDSTPDTTAPVISNVEVSSTSDTTAVIQWTTDEPSDSQVQYGTSSSTWGSYPSIKTDTAMTNSHSITLAGLNADTQYYFRVGSFDPSGNGPAISSEGSFTTDPTSAGDMTAVLGDVPQADYAGVSQDTYINSGQPTANYSDDSSLNTYTWPTDTVANRIILRWDVSAIPQNATIKNATLSLYMYGFGGTGGDDSYEISAHRIVNNDPIVSSCSWNSFDGVNSWTGGPNGGAQDIAAPESATIVNKITGYKNWDITQMVQHWISDPSTNLGLMLDSDSTATSDSNRYFRSTEYSNPDHRPKVTVTYTLATSPVISDVQVTSTTDTSAVIQWTTDVPCDSQIQYGISSSAWGNYPSSKSDTALVTSHSITITGLSAVTTYYFRVVSTDSSGNGPDLNPNGTNPSEEGSFATGATADTDPPSMLSHPTIDYTNNTIDIAYDEANMQNATIEDNYIFSPSLLFQTLGGSDDITYLGNNTYQLSMAFVPAHTIFTLTISNITDAEGNPVTPGSIRINDDDKDDMADDWELLYGVSGPAEDTDGDGLNNLQEYTHDTDPGSSDTDEDSLPDGWEVTYGLDPKDGTGANGGDGDIDNDGWTNYEEYVNSYNPASDTSPGPTPPEIKRTIPRQNSGITNNKHVPNDTSFAIYIEDSDGVDMTDTTSVKFTIDDSINHACERDLSDTTVVRAIKLTSDADTKITKLWVVYDRSNDNEYGNGYPFGQIVNIKVDVKDRNKHWMTQASYRFKIQSKTEQEEAKAKRPHTKESTEASTTTVEAMNSDELDGFKMLYETSEPVTPYLGSSEEIPLIDLPSVIPVGVPVNLGPPTVFDNPVTLFLPCPAENDVGDLSLYLYDGSQWFYACSSYNSGGKIQQGGDGWMVPGSLVGHNETSPPTIEVQVYHFSAIQAGFASEGSADGNATSADDGATSSGAGGGCFISSARLGSQREFYAETLHALKKRIGSLFDFIGRE